LEQREGFEPPVLRICNPLHWAALPPLHNLGAGEGGRTLDIHVGNVTLYH